MGLDPVDHNHPVTVPGMPIHVYAIAQPFGGQLHHVHRRYHGNAHGLFTDPEAFEYLPLSFGGRPLNIAGFSLTMY